MKRIGRSVVGALVVLVGVAIGSREARAAGFASAHFGGEEGNAITTSPTALYYNPGAIGFSKGIHLYYDEEIAIRDVSWNHPAPAGQTLMDSDAGNYGTARALNVFSGPTIAGTANFGILTIGAGLFVPFAGRVNFSKNDNADPQLPLTAAGVQRWHLSTAALTFIYATGGAALRLGPLSIGASGNFINSQISETEAHTLRGDINSTTENTASLAVKGNNGSFAVGAMLEAVPRHLWIGGSYQAQPGLGPQTLKGTLLYQNGPAPYYSQTGVNPYKVDFHESLPDIIRGAIRLKITDSVELRAFGDYTRWSKLQSQCINNALAGPSCQVYPDGSDATPKGSVLANIPRNWKDTYSVHFGGSYFVNPDIEIFAGVAYETGAAPDATLEPGAMDGNNYTGALGGRFFVAHYVYLGLSYTQIMFANRDVTTSQLATKNGAIVQVPTQQQDGNGQYSQWIGIFDLNLEKEF